MFWFFNEKTVKAKKEHVCELCGRTIEAGERYKYISFKHDDDFFILKRCESCDLIVNRYLDETGEGEYYDDDIAFWLQEEFCYNCEHGWHIDHSKDDCNTSTFKCSKILMAINMRYEQEVKATDELFSEGK